MGDDDEDNLQKELAEDVLAQIQRAVDYHEDELGEQHDKERHRYLQQDRVTSVTLTLGISQGDINYGGTWNLYNEELGCKTSYIHICETQ